MYKVWQSYTCTIIIIIIIIIIKEMGQLHI